MLWKSHKSTWMFPKKLVSSCIVSFCNLIGSTLNLWRAFLFRFCSLHRVWNIKSLYICRGKRKKLGTCLYKQIIGKNWHFLVGLHLQSRWSIYCAYTVYCVCMFFFFTKCLNICLCASFLKTLLGQALSSSQCVEKTGLRWLATSWQL